MHLWTKDEWVKHASGGALYPCIRISFESHLWEVCQQTSCLVNDPFLPLSLVLTVKMTGKENA